MIKLGDILQDVLAAPRDDVHRLAYADWLEEFGDHGADQARAEFIRLQCELAGPHQLNGAEVRALEQRCRELHGSHWSTWEADTVLVTQDFNNWWRGWPWRGAVSAPAVGWDETVYEAVRRLLGTIPLTSLCLIASRLDGRDLCQLAGWDRLNTLFLHNVVAESTDSVIRMAKRIARLSLPALPGQAQWRPSQVRRLLDACPEVVRLDVASHVDPEVLVYEATADLMEARGVVYWAAEDEGVITPL